MKVKCIECNSTGLKKSWVCKPNEAQVCLGCSGRGYVDVDFEPFVKKEKIEGIQNVILQPFMKLGKDKKIIPYEDWYATQE